MKSEKIVSFWNTQRKFIISRRGSLKLCFIWINLYQRWAHDIRNCILQKLIAFYTSKSYQNYHKKRIKTTWFAISCSIGYCSGNPNHIVEVINSKNRLPLKLETPPTSHIYYFLNTADVCRSVNELCKYKIFIKNYSITDSTTSRSTCTLENSISQIL